MTDKRFGNMNTYRGVMWLKLINKDNRPVFVFNSHYPLSGTRETRIGCSKTER